MHEHNALTLWNRVTGKKRKSNTNKKKTKTNSDEGGPKVDRSGVVSAVTKEISPGDDDEGKSGE